MTVPDQSLRILFVCTANIARSPYAECRARQMLGDAPIIVASAGVRARPGNEMDAHMAAELESRGGGGCEHVSQRVDEHLIAEADLVLAFEFRHHMDLLERFGEHAGKIAGFGQFAAALRQLSDDFWGPDYMDEVFATLPTASMTFDVDDPFGRGPKAAVRCADEIDAGLEPLVGFLTGAPRPDVTPIPPRRNRWWKRLFLS